MNLLINEHSESEFVMEDEHAIFFQKKSKGTFLPDSLFPLTI